MSTRKTKFLHQPEYPGGPKSLTNFLYQNLRYPESELETGVEGTVLVEYDIDNKGKVTESRVLQGLSPAFDEEAMRVVKLLKFDVPTNRGVRVIFHRKATLQFKKPVPPPAPTMTMQYTLVEPPKPEQPAPATPAQETYSYTVYLN